MEIGTLVRSRRFTIALLIAAALLAAAARMTTTVDCQWPSESHRPLDLSVAADAGHVAANRARADSIAEAFAQSEDAKAAAADTIDARLFAATRHRRAYEYCRAILNEAIAKTHEPGDVR
jgi:hypothetical protein